MEEANIQTSYCRYTTQLTKQQVSEICFTVLEKCHEKAKLVFLSIHFNLGKGNQVAFWHDVWVGDQPLKERFPLAFPFSKHPMLSVASYLEEVPTDIMSKHFLNSRIYVELSELQNIMDSTSLSLEDSVLWKWSNKNTFSVQLYYKFFSNDGIRSAWSHKLESSNPKKDKKF